MADLLKHHFNRAGSLLFRTLLVTGLAWSPFAGPLVEADVRPDIALVQYDSTAHFGDKRANLVALTQFAERAVTRGARLIVFPEGAIAGYATPNETWCRPGLDECAQRNCRDITLAAEDPAEGPTSLYWQRFAALHSVWIAFQMPEVDGNLFYNSLMVVGPEGLVTRYRKRSLYYIDECYAKRGAQAAVLDLPFAKFGLMVCADANEAEFFNEYRQMGVEQILISMDWDESPTDPYRSANAFFTKTAHDQDMDILAADNSLFDGTGIYSADGGTRQRSGMATSAVSEDGLSFH